MKLKKHLAQGNIIYFHPSEQQLTVAENSYYRWLCLNDVVQTIMLKRQPWQLTLPHQLAMVLPLLFFTPICILEIGLGGGALNRYIKQVLPHCEFTSLELNNTVIESFNRFFNPERIDSTIINTNAQYWLDQQPQLAFDWIVIDIFISIEDSVISYHLIETLLQKTNEKSLITLNLPNEKEQQIEILLKQLKQNTHVDVVYFYVPHYKNIIVHILPSTQSHSTANGFVSSLKPLQRKRWQNFWQQGIHLS